MAARLLDRLCARFGADAAKAEGWGLVILDLALDTTTPTGRLALTVLAAGAPTGEDYRMVCRTIAKHAADASGRRRPGWPAGARRHEVGAHHHSKRREA